MQAVYWKIGSKFDKISTATP